MTVCSGEFQDATRTAFIPGAGIPRLVKNWVTLSSVCKLSPACLHSCHPQKANKQQEGSLQRVPAEANRGLQAVIDSDHRWPSVLFTIARPLARVVPK